MVIGAPRGTPLFGTANFSSAPPIKGPLRFSPDGGGGGSGYKGGKGSALSFDGRIARLSSLPYRPNDPSLVTVALKEDLAAIESKGEKLRYADSAASRIEQTPINGTALDSRELLAVAHVGGFGLDWMQDIYTSLDEVWDHRVEAAAGVIKNLCVGLAFDHIP